MNTRQRLWLTFVIAVSGVAFAATGIAIGSSTDGGRFLVSASFVASAWVFGTLLDFIEWRIG